MRSLVLVAPFLLALAASAAAGTHTVHPVPGMGDFTSPAEALASPLVSDGDVVLVHPGTYAGTLVLDKAITLRSSGGAAVTVLDGAGAGPVVAITAGARVRGFTITGGGGLASVGGVSVTATVPVRLTENVIVDNHPLGDDGIPAGGVRVSPGAHAILRDNEIRGNTSLSAGALFASGLSTLEMFRDRIHGNGGSGTVTGGIVTGASGRLVDVQITGNLGSGIGAIFFGGGLGPTPAGASLALVHCTISGNLGSAPMGSVGGIYLDDGGTVTMRNTLLQANTGVVGSDTAFSPDFYGGVVPGIFDVDYSLIGTPGGFLPGAHMLFPGTDPLLTAPVAATPFAPAPFGDFAPLALSPLVDAGLDAAFPADLPPSDARPFATRFFGPATDIGAFERVPEHVRRAP